MRRLLCCMLLAAIGCGGDSPESPARPQRVRSAVQEGSWKLVVEASPAEARLSDEVRLVVRLEGDQDSDVQMPPFGRGLGEFLIRRWTDPELSVRDGRQVWEQTFWLEPTGTGMLAISSVAVPLPSAAPGADLRSGVLRSEPLTIHVRSTVPQPVELDDLQGLQEAPPERKSQARLWMAAAVAAVAALSAGVLWYLAGRRRIQHEPEARQRALRALDALRADELPPDAWPSYYDRLTGIVREYLEQVTAIPAAEQTSDEFLQAAATHPVFDADRRAVLQDFLRTADLVKFAGLRADAGQMHAAWQQARQLILEIGDSALEEQPA